MVDRRRPALDPRTSADATLQQLCHYRERDRPGRVTASIGAIEPSIRVTADRAGSSSRACQLKPRCTSAVGRRVSTVTARRRIGTGVTEAGRDCTKPRRPGWRRKAGPDGPKPRRPGRRREAGPDGPKPPRTGAAFDGYKDASGNARAAVTARELAADAASLRHDLRSPGSISGAGTGFRAGRQVQGRGW